MIYFSINILPPFLSKVIPNSAGGGSVKGRCVHVYNDFSHLFTVMAEQIK